MSLPTLACLSLPVVYREGYAFQERMEELNRGSKKSPLSILEETECFAIRILVVKRNFQTGRVGHDRRGHALV